MSINNSNNRSVGYKVVSYKPENGASSDTPLNFGTKRIPIKLSSSDKPAETAPKQENTPPKDHQIPSANSKLIENENPKSAQKVDESQLASEPVPEISFVTNPFSRDFILYQDKKPATSKTYHFQYNDETFPGAVTNSDGRLFLYDRAAQFHRPLKGLTRRGDPHSAFHAGFLEEKSGKKNDNNYVDLGNIEVLQAALQSSRDGKYTVNISENDSFLQNWMLATSPDNDEKSLYWLDNMVKLKNKGLHGFMSYAVPIATFAVPMAALIATGVSLGEQVELNKDLNDINNQNNNFDEFKLSINNKNQVVATFEKGDSVVVDNDILNADEARQLGITRGNQTTITVNDNNDILFSDKLNTVNNSSNLLTTREINDINNAYDTQQYLDSKKSKSDGLSERDKIGLTAVLSLATAGGGAYAYSALKNRASRLEASSREANIKQKPAEQDDTLSEIHR